MQVRFHSPMIIVSDIAKSKKFYLEVLHEEVTLDLGVYVVFKGGFSMMALTHWQDTIKNPQAVDLGARNFELYFEEDNIDDFVSGLDKTLIFTPLEEFPWGQRSVKILDPDKHVVEIAESMEAVARSFLKSGMSVKDTAEKTMFPVEFVSNIARAL
jgi:catechol 2,3-dioxygenase-like lactoylglutathione lyase family enzyme